MKNKVFLLSILMFSTALYAQETTMLSKDDLLEAFQIYNPTVLDKVAEEEEYQVILQQLLNTYSAPRNEQTQLEMVALVKNFDNSIRLQHIRMQYKQNRELQDMTGAVLNNLDQQTQQELQTVLESIYTNTLEIKKIQIKQYNQLIKKIKKDSNLSREEQKRKISFYKDKISQIKQEVRLLKTDSKARIAATAKAYLLELQTAYTNGSNYQAQAEQTTQTSVKSNPQKTAAQ